MALGIYTKPNPSYLISQGTDLYPFRITADGRYTGNMFRKLYIRNDNTLTYYTGITIQIIDNSVGNLYSSNGWKWKMIEGSHEPVLEELEGISNGNILSFSEDLGSSVKGDITTYLPFWIWVEIPSGLLVVTSTDVSIRHSSTEYLVTGF